MKEGVEGYEVSIASISADSGYFENLAIDSTNKAIGLISDDEPGSGTPPPGGGTPPGDETPNEDADTVYAVLSGPTTVDEGDTTTIYTVTLQDKDGNVVTVSNDTVVTLSFTNNDGIYTSEDTDYEFGNAQTTTTTITSGNSSATFTVDTNEDSDVEADETYNVRISNVATTEFENLDIDGYTDTNSNVHVSAVTTTIIDDDTLPTMQNITIRVSEEGLSGGVKDTIGENAGDDITNSVAKLDNMVFADSDGDMLTVTSVSLASSAPSLTSEGNNVTWSGIANGDGSYTLTGIANSQSVMTVNITKTGSTTVTLLKPFDHPTNSVEDILSFDLDVSVSDGTNTTSGTLNIKIEDDMPSATDITGTVVLPSQDTNILLIIDTSGSMGNGSGISGKTRMDATKDAVNQLLDTYAKLGSVSVRIVGFTTTATIYGGSSWTTDINNAKSVVSGLSATNSTNYDAGLAVAMDAYTASGKIAGATNVAYFFGDGEPNANDGNPSQLSNSNSQTSDDVGIQPAEEIIWETFLQNNDINSYALGIGTGLDSSDQAFLDPISYDGKTGTEQNAVMVTDFSLLPIVLNSTLPSSSEGNVFDIGVGADSGYVFKITVDGEIYEYDSVNNNVSTSGTNTTTHIFNSGEKELSIATQDESTFTINLDTGEFKFIGNPNATADYTEIFTFELIDGDGDKITKTITQDVNVSDANDQPTIGDIDLYVSNASSTTTSLIDAIDTYFSTDGANSFSWNSGTSTIPEIYVDGKQLVFTYDDPNQQVLGKVGSTTYLTIDMNMQNGDATDISVVQEAELIGIKQLIDGEIVLPGGGNNANIILGFTDANSNIMADALITASVVGENPATSHTVNTNNYYIGVDSNNMNANQKLTMDFATGGVSDGSGNTSNVNQVTAMSISLFNFDSDLGNSNPDSLLIEITDVDGGTQTIDLKNADLTNDSYVIQSSNGKAMTNIDFTAGSTSSYKLGIDSITQIDYNGDFEMQLDYTITDDTDSDSDNGTATIKFDGNNTVTGTSADEFIIYDSNDTLNDAGTGTDSLILDSGISLDFDNVSGLSNFENIDLSQTGNHSLSNLEIQDVIDMTDSNNVMKLLGDAGDSVTLKNGNGGNWEDTGTDENIDGQSYDLYSKTGDNSAVTLKIDQDITTNII